jgi:hypothetical protein
MKTSKRDERLSERTCKLIKQGCSIYLRRKGQEDWYLHAWTNIAAGWDKACWGKREHALEIFNLKWAFALARLYGCKVVSYNHRQNIETVEKLNQ